jgi:hypothetical protein
VEEEPPLRTLRIVLALTPLVGLFGFSLSSCQPTPAITTFLLTFTLAAASIVTSVVLWFFLKHRIVSHPVPERLLNAVQGLTFVLAYSGALVLGLALKVQLTACLR